MFLSLFWMIWSWSFKWVLRCLSFSLMKCEVAVVEDRKDVCRGNKCYYFCIDESPNYIVLFLFWGWWKLASLPRAICEFMWWWSILLCRQYIGDTVEYQLYFFNKCMKLYHYHGRESYNSEMMYILKIFLIFLRR